MKSLTASTSSMDKIDKFLNKLDVDRKARLLEVLVRIRSGNHAGLSVSKLIGSKHLYKYRQGKIRVVFSSQKGVNSLVNIDFRDKVYRDL